MSKIIGMLVLSSNTVIEPSASAMLAGLAPDVSVHFARFPVTEISLDDTVLRQFDAAPMIAAARLLRDARPNVIAWNGTSGGWLGTDADRALCKAITEATGAVATTATLAMIAAFGERGFTRCGLVTPYLDAVQARIIETLEGEGLHCLAERHLSETDNFAFSEVSKAEIAAMVYAVAAARPQAIAIYCTNLRGAPVAEALERETGIPVIDSVSLTVWQCLRLCGIPPSRVTGWGSLFA